MSVAVEFVGVELCLVVSVVVKEAGELDMVVSVVVEEVVPVNGLGLVVEKVELWVLSVIMGVGSAALTGVVNAMVVAFSGSKVALSIDEVDMPPGTMGRDCVLWPVVRGTVVFSDSDSEVGAKVLAVVGLAVAATVDIVM